MQYIGKLRTLTSVYMNQDTQTGPRPVEQKLCPTDGFLCHTYFCSTTQAPVHIIVCYWLRGYCPNDAIAFYANIEALCRVIHIREITKHFA